MSLKIATWNLCLGLLNKKDIVLDELVKNDIDVCCLQETELGKNCDLKILNSKDFELETETSNDKIRVGIYVKNTSTYKRRQDLEDPDCHLIIIDLFLGVKIRVITLYRSFRPPNNLTPIAFFKLQLGIIRRNAVPNLIVLGDFNLDAGMQFNAYYSRKNLFNELNPLINDLKLHQLVDFTTWSRSINNALKESTLDHIYTNTPELVFK